MTGDAAFDAARRAANEAAAVELRRVVDLFGGGDVAGALAAADQLHQRSGLPYRRACELIADRVVNRWDREQPPIW